GDQLVDDVDGGLVTVGGDPGWETGLDQARVDPVAEPDSALSREETNVDRCGDDGGSEKHHQPNAHPGARSLVPAQVAGDTGGKADPHRDDRIPAGYRINRSRVDEVGDKAGQRAHPGSGQDAAQDSS